MKYVIEFSKTGRCAYISHLDLARAFLRALRMTGLRPSYSQGFNPHPKMSIALPLSLGQSSVCELIEVETGESQAGADAATATALNERLPDGVRVLSLREKPVNFPKPLASYVRAAEYEILCDGIFDANAKLAAFFERERVLVLKTSKKTGQTAEKDIRPDMLSFTVKKELKGWLLCRVTLRAEAGALLNPGTFFDAFAVQTNNVPSITRTAILGEDGAVLSGRPR
jgi:radical SAM-linked protein